jgi:glycopeptide antibiotics resistance protein
VIPTRYWLGENTEPVFFIPELLTLNRSGVKDIVLNLLGFVPFGYVLANCHGRKRSVLLTVGVAAVASLFVEVSQAWIATRYSSLLDWIFNMSGAWLGAVVRWLANSAAKR